MADTPDFSLMKQQIEEIKALAYDLGVRIRRQWWNDARGSVRETPDAVQLSGMQMTNTPDLDSLRAILAKRTPGEWKELFTDSICADDDIGAFVVGELDKFSEADKVAIVAAVNAIGPLLERVQSLSLEVEALRGGNYDESWRDQCEENWRLEAENKRLLERVRELERENLSLRVGSAACDQAADDDEEVIDKLEAQLAAANERIAGLEAERCPPNCKVESALRELSEGTSA